MRWACCDENDVSWPLVVTNAVHVPYPVSVYHGQRASNFAWLGKPGRNGLTESLPHLPVDSARRGGTFAGSSGMGAHRLGVGLLDVVTWAARLRL